jgi:spore maturation protein CgeB
MNTFTQDNPRILIVGNPDPIHMGAHFLQAARASGFTAQILDTRQAYDAFWPLVQWNWRLRGHRPARLGTFSAAVLERCRAFAPDILLATGLAPLDRETLAEIGKGGSIRINFLTDDPWNRAHYAPWFLQSLPFYDYVFTPRRSNIDEIKQIGCHRVDYLPFAYHPELHFVESPENAEERERFSCDIVFVGGADRDRLPFITALLRQRFQVALYGGYWERYPATRPYTRGHTDITSLRKAISAASVSLCLVRRANRDGHVMRSFEIPAMGGCMLTEDTTEHRELFGAEGETVVYFSTIDEMLNKLRWLLDHPVERQRLATAAHQRITGGGNTYRDRLLAILQEVEIPVKQTSIPQ